MLKIALNSCLKTAFDYKNKNVFTKDLHLEANILTPYQKWLQIATITSAVVLLTKTLSRGFWRLFSTGTYAIIGTKLCRV